MKFLSLCILLILFFVWPAKSQSTNIIGKWESALRDSNGTKVIIQFRENGSLSFSNDIHLNMKYKILDDKLILEYQNPSNKITADTSLIRIAKNNLSISKENSPQTAINLRGFSNNSGGILGSWSMRSNNGETINYIFKEDGTAAVIILIPAIEGKFSVSGNDLLLSFNNKIKNTAKFNINNGSLYLSSNIFGGRIKLNKIN